MMLRWGRQQAHSKHLVPLRFIFSQKGQKFATFAKWDGSCTEYGGNQQKVSDPFIKKCLFFATRLTLKKQPSSFFLAKVHCENYFLTIKSYDLQCFQLQSTVIMFQIIFTVFSVYRKSLFIPKSGGRNTCLPTLRLHEWRFFIVCFNKRNQEMNWRATERSWLSYRSFI